MTSAPVQQLPFRTLREAVAESIRQAILDGSIKPGQKIMDVEVAERMGVSRSPVREALRALEKEGLVRSTPNRGTSVVELGNEDVSQLYALRGVLDGLAAAGACEHITDEELERLRGICRDMRALLPFASEEARRQFVQKDMELHDIIISAARFPLLKDMLASVRMQIRIIMIAASVSDTGSAEAAAEHEELVETIAKRDPKIAEATVRRATAIASKRVVRLLFESSGK